MVNFKHYKTKEAFLEDKSNIKNDDICFILESKEIWTHDAGYQTLPPNWEENLLLEVTENGPEWVDRKDIIVGNAINLQGNNTITHQCGYHPTGGNEDVLFGTAQIENIQGNAVAWNQLVKNGNFADGINSWDNIQGATSSISNNVITINPKPENNLTYSSYNKEFVFANNHKLLFKCDYYLEDNNVMTNNIVKITTNNVSEFILPNVANKWDSGYIIFTTTGDITTYLDLVQRSTVSVIKFRNIQLFDLTLIYGAGKEPTTPEQFEADYQRWFGKTLEYEEYDEGSLRPVLATGIKTVGFNLSKINELKSNSVNSDWYKRIILKNDFLYKGQFCVSFYVKDTNANDGEDYFVRPGCIFYYTDGTYDNKIPKAGLKSDYSFEAKSDPNKIVSYITGSFGRDGYFDISNICINMVWSGKRDGDYEPYWEETYPLPITELTSNGVKIFPDGLKSAGDVHDEIFVENGVTKAVKRIGSVDLGNAVFTNETSIYNIYQININTYNTWIEKRWKNFSTRHLCGKYSVFKGDLKGLQETNKDKLIYIHNAPTANPEQGNVMSILDRSYDSASELKNSLKGVIWYYELETPETYVIDNFNLPLVYKIDDFGTEQILMPENSIAPTITSRYGVNAVDAIRNLSRNYVNKNGDTIPGTLSFTNKNPFNIQSTEVIKNLNADMVDGKHDGEFTAIKHAATKITSGDANDYLSSSFAGTMIYKGGGSHVDNLPETVHNDNGCLLSMFLISGSVGQLSMQTASGNPLWFRVGSTSSSGTWRRIAYVTDTVEAANRLIAKVETTTNINKVPTTTQMCVVNASTSGTFGLDGTMTAGTELQVMINNTGSNTITIAIPTTFKSNGLDSISIDSGNYGEINVISDGTNLYLRAI